jgi:hypothetical protein
VFPSWDNTARVYGRGLITLDSTPENYERWLNGATHRTLLERRPSQRMVFINAWNEWAEGCHLEPDRRHGSGFLEATLRVKERRSLLDGAFYVGEIAAPPGLPAPGPPTLSVQPKLPRPWIIRRIEQTLLRHPRLFHAGQLVWRDILRMRAWMRRRARASQALADSDRAAERQQAK